MIDSQALLENVFSSINEAVFVFDHLTHTILLCNPLAERMFGYTREEMIGRQSELLHVNRAMRNKFVQKYQSALDKDHGVFRLEFRLKRKDGTVFFTDHSVAPILDETGHWYASVSLIRDITALKQAEQELETKKQNLEDSNTALKVLLKQLEQSKAQLEEKFLSNIKQLVHPYIGKLKQSGLTAQQSKFLETIEENINNITCSFLQDLKLKYFDLTPREIEMAFMVRDGKSVKEIAMQLNITSKTVEFHRSSLRQKLGLKNKKNNLRAYLRSLNEEPTTNPSAMRRL